MIQDLFDGHPVAVTYITTRQGHVRGNHVHMHTTQWTFVVEGRLTMAKDAGDGLVKLLDVEPGTMVTHQPGEPHAWKALEDCGCFVFTRGPRSGQGYETDTVRLDRPLLT